MNFTGRITGISRDYKTANPIISLEVNESLHGIEDLQDKNLSIKLTKYREKRSLDANALLWHCLGKIAKTFTPPRDKWEIYLESLKKYGKYSYILMDERAVESFKRLWRETEVVGDVDVNGRKAVQLLCYYGSSTYNTKEFSVLLDGVIEDMKDLGLQPPIPRDVQTALEEWERLHGRKEEKTGEGIT